MHESITNLQAPGQVAQISFLRRRAFENAAHSLKP